MVINWGMLNSKDPGACIENFKGLADEVNGLSNRDEVNTLPPDDLARAAQTAGLVASTATSLQKAL